MRRFPFLKEMASVLAACELGTSAKNVENIFHIKSAVSDIQVCFISTTRRRMTSNLTLREITLLLQFRLVVFTRAGEQDCKLAIVPVKIKSKKGQTVEIYAFLDQGKSASFCTVGLKNKLNHTGRKT